jgi:hypothetical protein
VPRHECHRDARDVADGHRRGRFPVRRLDLDVLHLVEERVEARAPEDPDPGRGQAERSLALPEDELEEELASLDDVFALPSLEPPDAEPEEDSEEESDLFSFDVLSPEEVSECFFEPSPDDRLSVE